MEVHVEDSSGRNRWEQPIEKLFDGVREQAVDGDAVQPREGGRRHLGYIIWEDGLVISAVGDGEVLQQRGMLQEVEECADGRGTAGGDTQVLEG